MKCAQCNVRIGWIDSYKGVNCHNCGTWVRSETARILVWSLLVDVLLVAVFVLNAGWILGTIVVLGGGIALFFLMDCKIQVKGIDLEI